MKRFCLWIYACAVRRTHFGSVAVLSLLVLGVPGELDDGEEQDLALAAAQARGRDRAVDLIEAETESVYAALGTCGSALPDEERWVIAGAIIDEAAVHGYDPFFVQAIVEVESTCRPSARSDAGAVGLIQVKPSTARAVADRSGILWEGSDGLLRPEVNVQLGLHYLAELEERFSDPYLAVAAYNLGPARVANMEPAKARGSRYVRKVMSRYEGLLQEHATTAS